MRPQPLTSTVRPATVVRMQSEWGPGRGLDGLFEDLEQQAEGLVLADRDTEITDRVRAEYAAVTFCSRVHASTSSRVRLVVDGLGVVEGTVLRVGADWCLVVGEGGAEWVVRLDAVLRASGLAGTAVAEVARPALTRLGLRSVLRGMAEARTPVLLAHRDGSRIQGHLLRVGADFVELAPDGDLGPPGSGPVELVPFGGLAGVRPR